jgi:hypothetical protein
VTPAPAAPSSVAASRPVLPAAVRQIFVPPARLPHDGERLLYRPRVLAAVAATYSNAQLGLHEEREFLLAAVPGTGAAGLDWSAAEELSVAAGELEPDPEPDAAWDELPEPMTRADSYRDWDKQLRRWLGLERALTFWKSASLKVTSTSGEGEREFRIRLQQLGNERRDQEAAKLKQKYAAKFAALEARELRAVQAEERQSEQARGAKVDTAIAIGGAVLGAIFGRGRSLASATRAGSAMRRAGRAVNEAGDVRRAAETLEKVRADQAALQAQFQQDLDALTGSYDAQAETLTSILVKPKAGDIEVRFLGVGWVPYLEGPGGEVKPI